MLFSPAATEKFEEDGTENRNKMDFIDVRRAYFHARARRDVYIKLPDADYEEGMCGKLNISMYGMCSAATNWQAHYTKVLVQNGFTVGLANNCTFYNDQKQIWPRRKTRSDYIRHRTLCDRRN